MVNSCTILEVDFQVASSSLLQIYFVLQNTINHFTHKKDAFNVMVSG